MHPLQKIDPMALDLKDFYGPNADYIYKAKEVDAFVAELKADNERLKIENEKAWRYAHGSPKMDAQIEMLDAGVAFWKKKYYSKTRALWMMKAKFFFFMMCWCAQLEKIALPEIIKKGNFFQDDGLKSREKYSHEATLFDDARIKCLKKAEQYK